MSSYLEIRIINKNKYEEYSNKYDEYEKMGKGFSDDWDSVYKIINENSFVLIWSSRSFRLYQTFEEAMGFTYKSKIINAEGLKYALEIINKDYSYYNSKLDYYEKYGYFKNEINSKRMENAVNYLDSIKVLLNEEKIDNIKTMLLKIENDEGDYPYYNEIKDELDDIVHAKKVIEALLIFLDYIDNDSLLIYDMD